MDPLAYNFRPAFSIPNEDNTLGYDAFQAVLKKSQEEQSTDLFKPLREVLIVGRILGVIPLSGVFKHSYLQLSFRRKSIAAIVSCIITAILTINLVFALIQWVRTPKRNALQIAQSIHRTAQYCWGWIIYVSFLFRAEKFLDLFKAWSKACSSIFYSVEDKTLRRDGILVCALILISCILENLVLHLEYFKELDHISGANEKYQNLSHPNQSSLETYYWRSNPHWAANVGFNDFFAVLAFIQHKWMLYTWNYLDVLLAVIGRATYFKFKMLYELSHEHLSAKSGKDGLELSKTTKVLNKNAWTQVVADHKHLYDLLNEIETFFSPLVFGSYAVNIYYICIQLLIGLSPDIIVTHPVQMIYGPWSFLHMAIRIYLVSICVARINHYAHLLRKVLEDCPIELYKGEIARVDKRLTAGPPIGLTGMGCFVVTKPFILSIISVIFTFEIVLLQGVSSGPPPQQHTVSVGTQEQCCCSTK